MPQIRIIDRAGAQQLPTASAQNVDAGVGRAVQALGQTTTELAKTMDTVAKYRAEQASLQYDQELKAISQEMTANPTRMLDESWKDEFDTRADEAREKYRRAREAAPR